MSLNFRYMSIYDFCSFEARYNHMFLSSQLLSKIPRRADYSIGHQLIVHTGFRFADIPLDRRCSILVQNSGYGIQCMPGNLWAPCKILQTFKWIIGIARLRRTVWADHSTDQNVTSKGPALPARSAGIRAFAWKPLDPPIPRQPRHGELHRRPADAELVRDLRFRRQSLAIPEFALPDLLDEMVVDARMGCLLPRQTRVPRFCSCNFNSKYMHLERIASYFNSLVKIRPDIYRLGRPPSQAIGRSWMNDWLILVRPGCPLPPTSNSNGERHPFPA